MTIFSLIGIRLTAFLFNLDIVSIGSSNYAGMDSNTIDALKFFNLFTTLGAFLVPAFIMPRILRKNTAGYLKLNRKVEWKLLLYIIVLFGVLYPFLEWTLILNQSIHFPSSLQNFENALRIQEDNIEVLTLRFMEMGNVRALIINLVVIAFLPAFMEELFFRGLLQTLVHKWLKNIHVTIIFTAIFFSAIHMQFFGIIPRAILGLILGYLFFWSGSIWAAIFFHFLNNATAVVLVFLSQQQIINYKTDEPMNSSNWVIILSLGITALIFLYLANHYSKKRDKKDDWMKVYETDNVSDAEIVKGKLEDNDIDAVILNKKDSSYTTFGPVEVYVKPSDHDAALQLLNEQTVTEDNDTE
jgi:membrane protease YdiL (CAAX protease family)